MVTGHLESVGRHFCCCGPKLGRCHHHHFRYHPAFRGCQSDGYLFSKEGMLPIGGWESIV